MNALERLLATIDDHYVAGTGNDIQGVQLWARRKHADPAGDMEYLGCLMRGLDDVVGGSTVGAAQPSIEACAEDLAMIYKSARLYRPT